MFSCISVSFHWLECLNTVTLPITQLPGLHVSHRVHAIELWAFVRAPVDFCPCRLYYEYTSPTLVHSTAFRLIQADNGVLVVVNYFGTSVLYAVNNITATNRFLSSKSVLYTTRIITFLYGTSPKLLYVELG